jgi:site-specific DNA-methyltransferase (adenine-specific)
MTFEVHNGDALEVMPLLLKRGVCADACLVTDPSYGTGGWRRTVSGAGDNPAGKLIVEEWDEGATEWLSIFPPAVPVLTFWPPARTSQLLNAANAHGLTKHRALYMRKPDPKPQVSGRVKWSVEPIWVLSQDGFLLYGGDDCFDDCFEASTPRAGRDSDATGHPYQKPLSVMRWLIAKTTAGTIIDPFMGSASTGVAAILEGRNFVGIDSDSHWCKYGEARMRRASGEACDLPRRASSREAGPLFDSAGDVRQGDNDVTLPNAVSP